MIRLLPIVVGALLVTAGATASAEVSTDQYCQARTIAVAPIKAVPSDAEPAIYVLPAGTSLWVVAPPVNHYFRVPESPPPPSRSGWVHENDVHLVSCVSEAALSTGFDTSESQLEWYAKHVKSTVENIRVFDSPVGGNVIGSWPGCKNFWVDRTDGDRYHTIDQFLRDVWVTSDPSYVAPGHISPDQC